jgi:hypothetical protein
VAGCLEGRFRQRVDLRSGRSAAGRNTRGRPLVTAVSIRSGMDVARLILALSLRVHHDFIEGVVGHRVVGLPVPSMHLLQGNLALAGHYQ